jgi:hypothetical protein
MTREDLVEHVRRRPFIPIRITITTGRTFDLYHPDLIMVGRREAVVGLTLDPSDTVYDRSAHVDLSQITAVEPLPAAKPRVLGMHPGSMVAAPDFDDPLPDEFWLGQS